jgi:energy-converting hydrogenase Eha subunit E
MEKRLEKILKKWKALMGHSELLYDVSILLLSIMCMGILIYLALKTPWTLIIIIPVTIVMVSISIKAVISDIKKL